MTPARHNIAKTLQKMRHVLANICKGAGFMHLHPGLATGLQIADIRVVDRATAESQA
jgi:hypothetical protein